MLNLSRNAPKGITFSGQHVPIWLLAAGSPLFAAGMYQVPVTLPKVSVEFC